MKKIIGKVMLLLLCLVVSISIYGEEQPGTLRITVNGIRGSSGSIRVALYSEEKSFLDEEKVYQSKTAKVVGDEVRLEFSGLPTGEYAVAVFHDENSNKKLDTNFLGIPNEAYGFSNGPHGAFGPPSFKDAKVTMNEDSGLDIVVTIK